MSLNQSRLASYIIREHYGDTVEKICSLLIRKGPTTLRDIVQETSFDREQVKKSLCSLIHHQLVSFEHNKHKVPQYSAHVSKILHYTRFPQIVYMAKILHGDAAELIVEEVLQNGSALMSGVVQRVAERLQQCQDNQDEEVDLEMIKEKFVDLVQGHYLKRVPVLVEKEGDLEQEENLNEDEFLLPPGINESGFLGKRKRAEEPSQTSKRQKTGAGSIGSTSEAAPDEGILWHINFDLFHQQMTEDIIFKAVCKKVDMSAGEIIKAILKADRPERPKAALQSKSISIHEIQRNLHVMPRLSQVQVSQYLSILANDEAHFICKTGDSGGGMYAVDICKCLCYLSQKHIETIVQERFGSKSLRIFRLLIMKKFLEQKQVGELAMIPSKEAKEILYALFAEQFITLQEIPRAADYAPSRTFYLFSVNLKQLSRMVLERSYQAQGNLMKRREHETQEYRRVIEKAERIEATIASLRQQEGDNADAIAELEEMIQPSERDQLDQLKKSLSKLERGEVQVDETIFILSSFLMYQ